MKKDDWRAFWEKQTTPLHANNTEFGYELYAREINLIVASLNYPGGKVLELGCGNGALFDHFDFIDDAASDYVGIDYSASLVNIFQKNTRR